MLSWPLTTVFTHATTATQVSARSVPVLFVSNARMLPLVVNTRVTADATTRMRTEEGTACPPPPGTALAHAKLLVRPKHPEPVGRSTVHAASEPVRVARFIRTALSRESERIMTSVG